MRKIAPFRKGSISYTIQGRGRAVVLLHGFLGSAETWSDFAKNLAGSYRVVCIDLPGHGESDCFGYVHGMELMANAVKIVLDSLRLKKYVIAGHSMGGYVALAFAELFPDNLRGMALFHTTSYPDTAAKKHERERAVQLIRHNRKVYTDQTVRGLFANKNIKYLKKEIAVLQRIARKTSRQGMAAALLGMRDRPGRDIVLGLVDYPVMMVIGGEDTVIPAQQLKEQAELIRKPFVLYLEHDGHMGFIESSRQCARELRRFLRRCFVVGV